jgi:hypothetical protein
MFVILVVCGGFGFYKNYNTIKTESEKSKYSTKASTDIIVGGLIANKSDTLVLQNFITAIFNDSKNYLTESDNEIILSDMGKITTATKYMYLEKELSLTQGLNEQTINDIVIKTKALFGEYIKFDSFNINYSEGNCGSGGYDSSIRSTYGNTSKSASALCASPYLVFENKQIRYDKNTYVVLVNIAYAEEVEFTGDTSINFDNPICGTNEKNYYHTVNVYSDLARTDKFYTTSLDGCCTTEECITPGILKTRSTILKSAEANKNQYYVRFDKINGVFQLKSIEKN